MQVVPNEYDYVNTERESFAFVDNLDQSIQSTAELQSNNNENDSIDEYFNLIEFKEIVTRNNLKVRSSTNLDSFAPPSKKNNFTLDQIFDEPN